MEPHEVDMLLRSLIATMEHQRSINDDFRVFIHEQREFNRQQIEINQHLAITQARIETLLARMLRQGGNGQEA